MYFLKIFMLYLLTQPEPANVAETLTAARLKNQKVALENPLTATQYQLEGEQIFHEMREMAQSLQTHIEQWDIIDDLEEVLTHPELTPAAKLLTHVENGSLMKFGQAVARKWYHDRINTPALLPQLQQLSDHAQRFVRTALHAGIRFYQVRDENGADLLMFTFDGITQVLEDRDTRVPDADARLRQLFPDLPALPAPLHYEN